MTNTKHTPGPWQVLPPKEGQPSITIAIPSNDAVYVAGSTKEANARLIAAAPELLEALEAMVEMYGPRGSNIIWDGPIPLAQEAINKARGQE